jgi:hypothetical protein
MTGSNPDCEVVLDVDVPTMLLALATQRPVFHSERDFQHALAWQIQQTYPESHIRLEPRPRRGIHLDVLVRLGGRRTAIELKYLVAALHATVDGELFDLPSQSAQDISRHDVIKDITRVEALLADGYADRGFVLVLSNDRSYWQQALRADTIDAAFRIHEGRVLAGTLSWTARAGRGTTTGRDTPLHLTGSYTCSWQDYSRVARADGKTALFRYLPIAVGPPPGHPAARGEVRPEKTAASAPAQSVRTLHPTRLPAENTARAEILATARKLAEQSADGSFTLAQIIAAMRWAGTRYAESTIRTHVTSRMCADAPDHHATTYDDFHRLGEGHYRLRDPSPGASQ